MTTPKVRATVSPNAADVSGLDEPARSKSSRSFRLSMESSQRLRLSQSIALTLRRTCRPVSHDRGTGTYIMLCQIVTGHAMCPPRSTRQPGEVVARSRPCPWGDYTGPARGRIR